MGFAVPEFSRLVQETAPGLFRLAARLLGSLDEAEDVVQECFVRAHDRIQAGRADVGVPLEPWLRRIVVNASLDALRARRRRAAREVGAARDATVDPSASLEARAALRELAEWLKDLPPEQRAALVLKELEGHSAGEIAVLLGCSEGAVEQRLVRARAWLRERRDDHEGRE